jgi:hypothetical protein
MCAAEEVIHEAIGELGISGVDYYSSQSNAEDFFCCDPLLVQMKDWCSLVLMLVLRFVALLINLNIPQRIHHNFVHLLCLCNRFIPLRQV